MSKADDGQVKAAPLLDMLSDWEFLLAGTEEERLNDIRIHERTSRPLGAEGFIEQLESALNRTLKQKKPGPNMKRN